MKFNTAMISNKGRRLSNQDYVAFYESSDGGCWVLADGLGGYQAGEVAAKLAVETILQEYKQNKNPYWLKDGLEKAQAILHLEQKNAVVGRSMRTTIVVLNCNNHYANWAHVGDSRLYLIREGKVIVQTKDHSVCQSLVNAGEITTDQIRYHEDRNRLYRVLGSEGAVKATMINEEVQIQDGDTFLLCSDGFWEFVLEEEMENTRIHSTTPCQWLEKMEAILKERFRENHDNYSAIAVYIQKI